LVKTLIYIFCGFCVGAADLVPGISGGTMALILGIYEDLIKAIKSFGRGRGRFVLSFLAGILLAFFLLSRWIHFLIGHPFYRTLLYSFFIGLVFSSVILLFSRLDRFKGRYIAIFLVGALISLFLTTRDVADRGEFSVEIPLNLKEDVPLGNYDRQKGLLLEVNKRALAAMAAKGVVSSKTKVFFGDFKKEGVVEDFVSSTDYSRFDIKAVFYGALAISAMLLPGISGSYILLILGAYHLTIAAVAEFGDGLRRLVIDYDALFYLCNLGIGIILGAIFFSRAALFFLHRYRGGTISFLIGFMCGALRAVWPFWSYQYLVNPLNPKGDLLLLPQDPILPNPLSSIAAAAFLFAILGFVLPILLKRAEKTLKV